MKFKPFKAVLPAADKVHLVASRSYVSYSKEDLVEKLQGNPYTFLHVIHPDVDGDYRGRRIAYFEEVRKNYEKFLSEEIFSLEGKVSFFIYRQETPEYSFQGLLGAVSVEDYEQGKIKIHEHTISQREGRFTDYLDTTGINAEPVLLMSKEETCSNLMERVCSENPLYCFTTTDRVKHTVWQISNAQDIEEVEAEMSLVNELYIADGHHRSASSVALKQRKLEEGNSDEVYQYFMALVLSQAQLKILGFHRLVKCVVEFDLNLFLSDLKKIGSLQEVSEQELQLAEGKLGVYAAGKWYAFHFEKEKNVIDAEWLSKNILHPIFGIEDERTDKRISHADGLVPSNEIAKLVDEGKADFAFLLHPISTETLMRISDEGLTMPPKSTYILPKLRSGLVIYPMR
jgi:uncharacterized protein (DUF1015 family)